MSEQTHSDAYDAAVSNLIDAGSELCYLVGVEWAAVPIEERRETVERWQRAVVRIAALNVQRSNDATELE